MKILKKYNQSHLLEHYETLSKTQKNTLKTQISNLDFELIDKLINLKPKKAPNEILPMKSVTSNKIFYELGERVVKNKEYAYITMAGGQGTRLGHTGPKGTYVLKYGINKSLFELICDKLKNIYNKTGVYVPWYIMTSKENNEATIEFFEHENYFNYPKELIKFFEQEELPMVGMDNKIIMDSEFTIKMGANGSGGVFSSFEKSGFLAEIKKMGIKWILISGIDNPLIPIDNFELIGFSLKNHYKLSSVVTDKLYPEEKVGVFALKNGRASLIEYFEMTKEMNYKVGNDGKLLYKEAHLLINLFHIDILEEISNKELPYLKAVKKAYSHRDKQEVDAYKFETFIFDAFSYVDEVGLLQGKREEIFAPVKNSEGKDSPETAAELYLAYLNREVNN